jgi:hypothetical protein
VSPAPSRRIVAGLMIAEGRRSRRETSHERGLTWAVYTSEQMLEKHLKTCHFLPLFEGPFGVPTNRDSIAKSFLARQIQPDMW